jgi:hypothetical protein
MMALPFEEPPVSNRTSRAVSSARKQSRPPSSRPSHGADNADRALADIRAWTDLLVARGNRLLELAVRERETLAHRADRAGKDRPGSHAKPLA